MEGIKLLVLVPLQMDLPRALPFPWCFYGVPPAPHRPAGCAHTAGRSAPTKPALPLVSWDVQRCRSQLALTPLCPPLGSSPKGR